MSLYMCIYPMSDIKIRALHIEHLCAGRNGRGQTCLRSDWLLKQRSWNARRQVPCWLCLTKNFRWNCHYSQLYPHLLSWFCHGCVCLWSSLHIPDIPRQFKNQSYFHSPWYVIAHSCTLFDLASACEPCRNRSGMEQYNRKLQCSPYFSSTRSLPLSDARSTSMNENITWVLSMICPFVYGSLRIIQTSKTMTLNHNSTARKK